MKMAPKRKFWDSDIFQIIIIQRPCLFHLSGCTNHPEMNKETSSKPNLNVNMGSSRRFSGVCTVSFYWGRVMRRETCPFFDTDSRLYIVLTEVVYGVTYPRNTGQLPLLHMLHMWDATQLMGWGWWRTLHLRTCEMLRNWHKDGSDDSLSDFDVVSSTGLPNPSVRAISSRLSGLQNRMRESRPFKNGTCDACNQAAMVWSSSKVIWLHCLAQSLLCCAEETFDLLDSKVRSAVSHTSVPKLLS